MNNPYWQYQEIRASDETDAVDLSCAMRTAESNTQSTTQFKTHLMALESLEIALETADGHDWEKRPLFPIGTVEGVPILIMRLDVADLRRYLKNTRQVLGIAACLADHDEAADFFMRLAAYPPDQQTGWLIQLAHKIRLEGLEN